MWWVSPSLCFYVNRMWQVGYIKWKIVQDLVSYMYWNDMCELCTERSTSATGDISTKYKRFSEKIQNSLCRASSCWYTLNIHLNASNTTNQTLYVNPFVLRGDWRVYSKNFIHHESISKEYKNWNSPIRSFLHASILLPYSFEPLITARLFLLDYFKAEYSMVI